MKPFQPLVPSTVFVARLLRMPGMTLSPRPRNGLLLREPVEPIRVDIWPLPPIHRLQLHSRFDDHVIGQMSILDAMEVRIGLHYANAVELGATGTTFHYTAIITSARKFDTSEVEAAQNCLFFQQNLGEDHTNRGNSSVVMFRFE